MKLALHWKIIIGLLLGVIWAIISSQLGWSQFTIDWIAPFGTIFINLLKLIAVPLVLFSIISGVAGLGDPSSLGRMGAKTLLFYFATTVLAVSLGLFLVNMIKPGKLVDDETRIDNRISYEVWADSEGLEIKDGINYLQDPQFMERAQKITELSKAELRDAASNDAVKSKMETANQTKDSGPLQPLVDLVPQNIFESLSDNGSMLKVIFFALFFGISLLLIPDSKSDPVKNFVDGTMEIFLKMVDIVMQAAPFFVFA
ncbi:MAG TPA: dicarboxylate/amino acid:cation symporter, partial [Cryomorphaceae bacterium]|nr:dicarboxylate/amino acid:cation symporter [Cryomorphaceae bacterium]